jgi:hypothetical protein
LRTFVRVRSESRYRGGPRRHDALDRLDQSIHLVMKLTPRIESRGIKIGELDDAVRQVARLRHARAVDEDWNDWQTALERGLDFNANGIALLLDTKMTTFLRTEPSGSDDHENHIARDQTIADMLAEVGPEWDIVHIDKNRGFIVSGDKPIKDTAGNAR